jgi:hypothetical protein
MGDPLTQRHLSASPLESCFTSPRGAYHNRFVVCIYFIHYYAIALDLARRRLLVLLHDISRYSILPEHVFALLSTIHLVCMYKKINWKSAQQLVVERYHCLSMIWTQVVPILLAR